MNQPTNITLIGMAGVGKSHTSRHLAEELCYEHIEVDVLIAQHAEKMGVRIQATSDAEFTKIEEEVTIALKGINNIIIDTGGSVVYAPRAMNFLQECSTVVYLYDTIPNIKRRFDAREGVRLVGCSQNTTFEALAEKRDILYKKYSDVVIDVSKYKTMRDLLGEIMDKVGAV